MRHNNPQFTFVAATLAGRRNQARGLLEETGWNSEEVIRVASDETVLAPLYGQLVQLGIVNVIETEVSDFLSAYRELNGERNGQILRELEEIALHLNQVGIEPIVLKGLAYVLTGVYADPADRFLLDIDLLISPEDGLRAVKLLSTFGYTPDVQGATSLARDYHLPPMAHPERIRVELHQHLGQGVACRVLPGEDMRRRSEPLRLGSAVVRIPAPADLVTHLVLHSQLHHGYDQRIWPPLRAMYDLLLLTRRFGTGLNWLAIREAFRFQGQGGLLNLHLLQIAEVLQMSLPYQIRFSGPLALRWFRRRALWRYPWLRLVDPLYLFHSLIGWRLDLLPRLLHSTAGRSHVFGSPLRWSFYRNLLASLQK